MHIIRTIAVFILGAGFTAGAYFSGMAQRLPAYLEEIGHITWNNGQAAQPPPVVVRVSSSSQGTCPPRLRFLNLTQGTVFFSPPRTMSGPWGNEIRVPPGTSLGPGHGPAYGRTDRFAPFPGNCAPSTVSIELTQH